MRDLDGKRMVVGGCGSRSVPFCWADGGLDGDLE